MTAPALSQTWQFNVNQDLNSSGNGHVDRQRVLRALKNSLVGFASNAWVVTGSSDGSTGGMDGIDRWTTDSSLLWGVGAHGWIVLRQGGLGANVELLIDLGFGSPDQLTARLAIGGTGFSGGSAINPPTAPNTTASLVRGARWLRGDDVSTFSCALHVMQSSSGECTRVAVYENTLPKMFLQIDRIRTPIPALTDPIFMCWFGRYSFQNTEVRDAPLWYFYQHALGNPFGDAEPFRAGSVRQAGADLDVSFLCETIGSAPGTIGQRPAKINQIESATYALVPCNLYSQTPGATGYLGRVHDLWWGDENAPNGRGYPSDAAPAFVHWRNAVLPWNGSPMLTS